MTADLPTPHLLENITHFTHALRRAGLSVGTSQLQNAVSATARAGFTKRLDFYYLLRATLVTRPGDMQVFHQVFSLFWRDPDTLERMLKMMLPMVNALEAGEKTDGRKSPGERRANEAFASPQPRDPRAVEKTQSEMDARLSWSGNEILRSRDFDQMSTAETREAARMVAQLRLPVPLLPSRRLLAAPHGRLVDRRRMMQTAMRRGGEFDNIYRKSGGKRPPDLVVLCDISGSMAKYGRMMLRFLHALRHAPEIAGRHGGWGRVHGFTFGTRLTNVSRALGRKDADAALAAAGLDAPDWEGGTDIAAALRRFRVDWGRRVLGQGAIVLLITDGLERGDVARLDAEAAGLARQARRLLWLNPLLRFDGFSPRAAGVRALLRHADGLFACHSLNALSDFTSAFQGRGEKPRLMAGF